MKKLLLVTTALVGLASLAHAGSLPSQGLNAGSMSGSSATIGSLAPANNALQNGASSVNTSGSAYSTSTLGLTGSHSYSTSTGSIEANTDGTPNTGFIAPNMNASRLDQAYTSAGLTASGNVLGASINYTNQTSALSGQSLSLSNPSSPGSYTKVTTTGSSYSNAQLGLPTTTADAGSTGTIIGQAGQLSGFSAQRVDNATSAVGVQGYTSGQNFSVGGNLNAEANAGHTLSLQQAVAYQGAPTISNSISDTNSASSYTTASLGKGGVTLTSASLSNDNLSGGLNATPTNGGNYSGSSAVNAQTDMQLSGSINNVNVGPLSNGSLSAGGASGFNQSIN